MRRSLWVERKYVLNKKCALITCGHTYILYVIAHFLYTWTRDNIQIGEMELASMTDSRGEHGQQLCRP